MSRPTIHDVADAAQVSLATVDRVLNARGGVAQRTIDRVQDAVVRLGYMRDVSAANLSRGREYRFIFVLPDTVPGFVELLHNAVAAEQMRLRGEKIRLEVISTRAFDVDDQVAALRQHSAQTTDGLAVMASEHPDLQREVARLRSDGVSVITLVADLPRSERNFYVGPDNVVAGRTAGSFMGRFVRPGEGAVLMIAGSLAARDHMERVMGFRMVMENQFSDLPLLPAVQCYDDPDILSGIITRAQSNGPVAGIYAVGAGHHGLLDALDQSTPKPVVIAHELTEVSRAGLQSGAIDLVIDQNPVAEVRKALEIMRDLSDGRAIPATTGTIPLNIFVRENI